MREAAVGKKELRGREGGRKEGKKHIVWGGVQPVRCLVRSRVVVVDDLFCQPALMCEQTRQYGG